MRIKSGRHHDGASGGQTLFVTAAEQGIGLATALAFAAVGATVIVTDVSKNLLESLVSPAIHTFRLDVLDAAAITSAAAEAGPIDILFNCAGFVHQGTVLDATEAEWDFTLDLNVYLVFRTIFDFLPGMLDRQSGSIGDVSSAASRIKGA